MRSPIPVDGEAIFRLKAQARLTAAFGFDADELEVNRQGYITESQRRKIFARRWDNALPYGIAVLISLALFVGIVVDGVQKGNISLAGVILGTCIIGGMVILLIAAIERRRQQIQADLGEGGLESVSGCVEAIRGIPSSNRRVGAPQRLKIGGMEFETQALLQDVFVEGDYYRVYYVSQSMLILTVEYLGPYPPEPAKR